MPHQIPNDTINQIPSDGEHSCQLGYWLSFIFLNPYKGIASVSSSLKICSWSELCDTYIMHDTKEKRYHTSKTEI